MSDLLHNDVRYKLFVEGYCRRIRYVFLPSDIICLITLFSNELNRWKISSKELKTKLYEDYTTIEGALINIKGHKFITKLKRSRDRLYFGLWYQGTGAVYDRMRQTFTSAYNEAISNTIVNAFGDVVIEEEFDDIQLILHDFEDLTSHDP